MKKKIVTIGGGTGTYTVLSSLKKYDISLSAIVSMCDDGGSTGLLRDEYGVLPAGDVRRSLIALAADEDMARELFEYSIEEGKFAGHKFGNIFLAAAETGYGDFYDAVKIAGNILDIEGRVYPVTLQDVRLYAQLEDGSRLSGETNIDIPKHNPALAIKRIYTKPKNPAPNPDAIEAIKAADAIIIGPGDLYTSILPNFLVKGVALAIKNSKARKIYVCNLMTKYGETNNFTVEDFVNEVENYIGKNTIDYILFNSHKPNKSALKHYRKYNATLVVAPKEFQHNGLRMADIVNKQELIRHDKEKLAKALMKIIND